MFKYFFLKLVMYLLTGLCAGAQAQEVPKVFSQDGVEVQVIEYCAISPDKSGALERGVCYTPEKVEYLDNPTTPLSVRTISACTSEVMTLIKPRYFMVRQYGIRVAQGFNAMVVLITDPECHEGFV